MDLRPWFKVKSPCIFEDFDFDGHNWYCTTCYTDMVKHTRLITVDIYASLLKHEPLIRQRYRCANCLSIPSGFWPDEVSAKRAGANPNETYKDNTIKIKVKLIKL